MAETAILAVLSKLGELSEAKIPLHIRHDIVLLRNRLEWLQAFVRNTDRKRGASIDGLTWMRVCQIRDMAFDAEDALDDFFNEEVVGKKDQGCHRRWKAVRSHFTGLFTKVVVQHGLAGRIKMIKSRVDQISVNQQEYQIAHTPTIVLTSSITAIAAWRDNQENAVVLDRDVEILKQLMSRKDKRSLFFFMKNGPHHPMFISIVGDCGAGKNTLAKIIHRVMRSEIKMLVRCEMEPGSSATDFLGKVYECASLLCSDYERQMTAEQQGWDISDKLRCLLGGKRYLLILGGISSITILNCVRASLPYPNNDSNSGGCVMLILDTENEEVAWHANTMNICGVNGVHILTHLDRKRSGQLFLWKVLRKSQEGISRVSNQEEEKEEEEVRYEESVHRITGGHPMAIVLLAGLLRFKQKPVQWEAVLQQLESVYPPALDSNIRAIQNMFWASFEDLPRDIKSCFLYFAANLNNTCIYADELVRMWIGEGFIKPQNRKTMEEGGNDYLKELVLRCLVEVEEMKDGSGIQLVRVHKSLMGFLQSEVRESGFMEIINDNDIHDVPVRRLSVYGRRYTSNFGDIKFPKLRSFICRIIDKDDQTHSHDLEFLCSSKFIRIISIQGLRLQELPDRIGDMINLRYLRIDSQILKELPSSISRLLNLQTLDIRNTEVEKIDMEVWKIKTLRHVLATKLILPTTMPPVVEETEGGFGGSELQTLHGVRLDISAGWSPGKCPLDKMTSLLSLELEMCCWEQERHGLPPFKEALQNMALLGHLYLKGDRIPSCVFTHQNLQSLETMVLHGNVNWNNIVEENSPVAGHLLRKARPNLVQIKLRDTNEVPEIIKQQLGTILIKDD